LRSAQIKRLVNNSLRLAYQKKCIFIVLKMFFLKKVLYILLFFVFAVGFAQQNESAEIPGLKIYPNPVTQGKVFIETDLVAPKKIILFDVFGTPVLEKILKTKELALPKIKPGIYVIKIFAEAKSSTRKLVIK